MQMQRGYVFVIADNMFGVLTYRPDTRVLLRVIEGVTSIAVACRELALNFAGEFVPATIDQTKWGHILISTRDTQLLTN